MKNVVRYLVRVADTYTILHRGFVSEERAWNWVMRHDYGQYELDGGLVVESYIKEG